MDTKPTEGALIEASLCLSGRMWLATDLTWASVWAGQQQTLNVCVCVCVCVCEPTKAHVKHAISFIKDQIRHPLKVSSVQFHKIYQPALGGGRGRSCMTS